MKRLLLLILAALVMTSILVACNPEKTDDTQKKKETEAATVAPTLETDEDELPLIPASTETKAESGSADNKGSDTVDQNNPDSSAENGATVDRNDEKTNNVEQKNGSDKQVVSSSGNSGKNGGSAETTLPVNPDDYFETDEDELPFIPAK